MTIGHQALIDGKLLEEARQQVDILLNEVASLADQDLAPAAFYSFVLEKTLKTLSAPAGLLWGVSPQGNLDLNHQVNLQHAGLDTDKAYHRHLEMVRHCLSKSQAIHVPPNNTPSGVGNSASEPDNPTRFLLLLAPVQIDGQVVGLLEIFQQPECSPRLVPGFMQFLATMGDLISLFLRNSQRRQLLRQEMLWTKLESFSIHLQSSLNPTQLAYLVANQGRNLIECDRLSVALLLGRACHIAAISGVDFIDKSSRQVRLMRTLCQQVLAWGVPLVFQGAQDDSLPPGVRNALDPYLEESSCQLLVIQPLRDPRVPEGKKSGRAALIMEVFKPESPPGQFLSRLEVVSRHVTGPLYNAVQYRRIPMRWLWQPLASVRDGFVGKQSFLVCLVFLALALLVGALVQVPFPLKLEAKGQLWPEYRRWIYSPVEGHVIHFADNLHPGSSVVQNQSLVLMYDLQMELKLDQLASEMNNAQQEVEALAGQLNAATTEAERRRLSSLKKQKEFVRDNKRELLQAMRARTHAEEARPGYFWLTSPLAGTVLSWDFREKLTNRYVKSSDPLLRIGDKERSWEVELKIPQKHIGQVLKAFELGDSRTELDVDLLVLDAPTRTYKGKLARNHLAGEAYPLRENGLDTEPMVLASVRIDGSDIDAADRLPRDALVAGTEVHSKIRCGPHALGYSLFYGVWEVIYDKVIFFF